MKAVHRASGVAYRLLPTLARLAGVRKPTYMAMYKSLQPVLDRNGQQIPEGTIWVRKWSAFARKFDIESSHKK